MSSVHIKRRADYQPPAFTIKTVNLIVTLHPTATRVVSRLEIERQGDHTQPLVLDGHKLSLAALSLDDDAFDDYHVTDDTLTVNTELSRFVLETECMIDPQNNKALEGLYLANNAYCTQCEAEGFRRITYFLDRPDVLSVYTVKVIGNNTTPMLLSNGNPIEKGTSSDGSPFVVWHDPHPKPCYLFALVAGDFDLITDTYTTASKKSVALELYVDKGKTQQGVFALSSLKRAMKWDEDVFGLEYDLDIYMVVAVDFFNMGAMENKGLNVFNSKFVLAEQTSATDDDFFNVEAVIAHEYFHNWTGNRVTCRDWFQLSLKEGLTVFRDQQFSADMTSELSNRIKHVRVMREHQFAEDASAMSHPIRPDEVIEMNNFYTVTVYDKGAEVIRMLHTLMGPKAFRQGMDEYFKRHDGQAVTCDDFVASMQSATSLDLAHFSRWYSQSGTPVITVSHHLDTKNNDYVHVFRLSQTTPSTADQKEKEALYIPIAIELIDREGNHYSDDKGVIKNGVLILDSNEQTITVTSKKQHIIPVVLGNFSAPVKVENAHSTQDLLAIFTHANDAFSRWDALQSLYDRCIGAFEDNRDTTISEDIWSGLSDAIMDNATNHELLGECLVIPSFETLCQSRRDIDVQVLVVARDSFCDAFATRLEDALAHVYNGIKTHTYAYQQVDVNARRCKNVVLAHLSRLPAFATAASSQFTSADNMTDTLGALRAAQYCSKDTFAALMEQFEEAWKHDGLVLDKWFALHATQPDDNILSTITMLSEHPQFSDDNPNRVRSLIGSFAFYNSERFHAEDGSGYKFVADYLIKLDAINPQVAARIVTPLTQWHQFSAKHSNQMKIQLSRLLTHQGLSKDVFEKVSKSLAYNASAQH